MADKLFFDLTEKNVFEEDFEISPSNRIAGGDPDIEVNRIRMYIGSNPVVFNLRELYEKAKKEIPPEIDIFTSYNVFIINHTIGVVQEGGWDKVQQIGYRMRFLTPKKVRVLDVLPQSKYIKKIAGIFNFEADLHLNGEISSPDKITDIIEQADIASVGIGGKLRVATNSSIVGRFSFQVITPEVQSIGKGSDYSEWIFNKTDRPLVGDDIEMFQIVLADRFTTELPFEACIYSTISTWNFLPSRRNSDWVQIKCKL
ncbi:MAG: hypothetical protein MUC49_20950 [Raineya sp.]|jgi:hypothetical protein|nr:hypothetical protein [Raineya sp.]